MTETKNGSPNKQSITVRFVYFPKSVDIWIGSINFFCTATHVEFCVVFSDFTDSPYPKHGHREHMGGEASGWQAAAEHDDFDSVRFPE